jgi:hypothetical protein
MALMRSDTLAGPLAAVLREVAYGAPAEGPAYLLNRGDAGLLGALERIDAAAASKPRAGAAPIAAHVEHVRYGLSLMNRWAAGEPDPFANATWGESWRRTTVDETAWRALRDALRRECDAWLAAIGTPRELGEDEATEMIGSVAHLAYHLGALRQIERTLAGPPAND